MKSNNGLLTFKKTKINKVDGWAIWNKAFCIFIEIYCLKFSSKCINLVQYVGILNNLAGKFPFMQVYNHYKDFRQEMEQDPDLPWHKIDQQLWLTSLHGIHMINSSRGRMAGSKDSLFARNKTGPFTTALTTVGGAAGSHAASHTSAVTVGALTTPWSIALLTKTNKNSTKVQQANSKATPTPRGIPSAEQYVPPMPLKVDRLRVLLQHHPQQDILCYTNTENINYDQRS